MFTVDVPYCVAASIAETLIIIAKDLKRKINFKYAVAYHFVMNHIRDKDLCILQS